MVKYSGFCVAMKSFTYICEVKYKFYRQRHNQNSIE